MWGEIQELALSFSENPRQEARQRQLSETVLECSLATNMTGDSAQYLNLGSDYIQKSLSLGKGKSPSL